jgi:hypothetical protein
MFLFQKKNKIESLIELIGVWLGCMLLVRTPQSSLCTFFTFNLIPAINGTPSCPPFFSYLQLLDAILLLSLGLSNFVTYVRYKPSMLPATFLLLSPPISISVSPSLLERLSCDCEVIAHVSLDDYAAIAK